MTSVLNVDEIAAKDGTSPATLTKQIPAKAFVGNWSTSATTLGDSFNVSSVTDQSTGYAKPNWSNAFSNSNYAHVITDDNYGNAQGSINNQTTTQARAISYNNSFSAAECRFNTIAVGDLA